MRYIITALLVLMTAGFVACGFLLWRRRRETGDYSRAIQAGYYWSSTSYPDEGKFAFSSITGVDLAYSRSGMSVRCIKE